MKKNISNLTSDFPASVVVFLVAIPLCLGIAVASGVSEFSGIIAGAVGGIVVGLISGSSLSVSGPAAGLTAIVAAAILKLPAPEAFFLAVVIAGVFQIFLGVFKLGAIGDYVPNSVIKGMLAAIGIILILKQVPHLVGYDKDYEGDEDFIQVTGENTFSSFLNSLNHLTPIAFIIGITGIVILLLYEFSWIKKQKIFQLLNGPLVVVVMGILLNLALDSVDHPVLSKEAHLVQIPVAGSAKDFLSFLRFPQWKFIANPDVWITALTLALVASLETLLSLEAIDKLDPFKRVSPPNRELIAQGSGNIVSGMLGGLPVTSVIVRSSANVNAGAKTKQSAIIHGSLILLFVAFFPNWLNLIPKAALAAILVFTGYKLAKISIFKEHYRKGWDVFMPFVITIISIILTDLLKGVLIGVAIGIFYTIRVNFKTAVFSIIEGNNMLIRLRKDVSFFIKPILKNRLEKIPANMSVIIDVHLAEFIDKDVIDTINEYIEHAHLKNIKVIIKRNENNPAHKRIHLQKESIINN